jgi:hypothetical protein
VSVPAPHAVLRHRGPALLVSAVEDFRGDLLCCASRGSGLWRWPQMLEGAAQSAGLLAGLQPGGVPTTALIAEYRDVVIHAAAHAGPIRFIARLERRLLHFWRCRFEARAADGAVLLEGSVTLAPGRSPPGGG